MNTPRQSSAMPIGAAIGAMFLIQSGASLAKGLFPLVGASGATALRLLFASLMMLAIWRPWRARVGGRERRFIFAYGVVLGSMNLAFYSALSRIPLGVAVALEFTGPLGLALVSSRRRLDFLWVAIASIGVYLLLPIGVASAALDPFGVLLALIAGLFWALYIVFGQKAGAGGSGPAVAYGSVVASLVVAPFGFAHAGAALFSAAVVPTAMLVALLSSALPYSLEMISMTRLPARTFGILMSVEPAVAALSGFLILHEHLSIAQLVAIGMVIVASAGTVSTHEPATVASA
jgi:inner membrane transporter RhtA